MAKRKGSVPGTQQTSSSPSAAQVSAGRANLARGRAEKKRKREEALANGGMTATERWARLLDGSMTVKDLDDEEIMRMKVRAIDGSFSSGRKMPSHLAQQFKDEAIRRAMDKFKTAAPRAVQILLDMAEDPDTPPAVRAKVLDTIINRVYGRTPEVVHVKTDTAWEDLVHSHEVEVERDGLAAEQDEAS